MGTTICPGPVRKSPLGLVRGLPLQRESDMNHVLKRFFLYGQAAALKHGQHRPVVGKHFRIEC